MSGLFVNHLVIIVITDRIIYQKYEFESIFSANYRDSI